MHFITGENMVSKQASQTAENRQKTRRDDYQRELKTTDPDTCRYELFDRELFVPVKRSV